MPDYSFHGRGMEPRRMGVLVVPVRRVLRRIQRPWLEREVEILYELRAELDTADARATSAEARLDSAEVQLGQLRHDLEELRTKVREGEARSWDQTALAHRLAALEDAVRQG